MIIINCSEVGVKLWTFKRDSFTIVTQKRLDAYEFFFIPSITFNLFNFNLKTTFILVFVSFLVCGWLYVVFVKNKTFQASLKSSVSYFDPSLRSIAISLFKNKLSSLKRIFLWKCHWLAIQKPALEVCYFFNYLLVLIQKTLLKNCYNNHIL